MKRAQIAPLSFLIAAILALALAPVASAQTGPVTYAVALDHQPASHLVHVAVSVNAGTAASIDVAMPAWSPGAYSIQNPWRNVQEFSASDDKGSTLRFEKTDKQTWRIHLPQGGQPGRLVTASYTLFLRDYTDEMCYLRGPGVFMYVLGKRPFPIDGPVKVTIDAPASWRIQTGMEAGPDQRSFVAENFDTLIDASILIGPTWEQTEFDVKGVPHYIVFIGKGNYDKDRITRDTKTFVSYFLDLMGGPPYKKYVFFLRARQGAGAGGLEHLNSTDITFSAWGTHTSWQVYREFLFVAAHEYFHLWNVKRIRPAILGPFDYSHEQNTRNLYVSEGMTSYWAALGLKRSGLWSRKDYFENLATQISTLQSAPGRKLMSAEQSSWDTWNRGDNAANTSIDYYNKGELLGNLLDLEVRYRTENRRSLDDVFHYLQKNYSLPRPGFEEVHGFRDAVETIVREVAPQKADFGDFFAKYVSGTEEIPWNEFLAHAGLTLEEKKAPAAPYLGAGTGNTLPSPSGFFGAPPTVLPPGQLGVTSVATGSPALEAGLEIGDILVAMDGDRVDAATFTQRLSAKAIGSTIALAVLRRDRLVTVNVVVGAKEAVTYAIKERPEASDAEKTIFTSWLAEKSFAPQTH